MLVKELENKVNLTKVKVKVPEVYQHLYEHKEMWIGGFVLRELFLTPDPPGAPKRKLLEMPSLTNFESILDWEIAQLLTQ